MLLPMQPQQGLLDAAENFSMAKSLETPTLANATLIREVASL